jgi:hypothetical protein
MSRTKMMMLVAGAALSTSGMAFAADNVSRDEVRAIVREVLADAETRTSMLQGASAGYNNGFVIGDGGANLLRINAYSQFRYTANFRSKSGTAGQLGLADTAAGLNTVETGFGVRRTVVTLSGTVANENLGYVIGFDTGDDDSSGSFSNWKVDDAYFTYKLGDGFTLAGGQMKAPLLKEELNSDINTLAADRGVVNSFFTIERTQGVSLRYDADQWNATVAFTDGARAANTRFTNAAESSYAFTGRFEYFGGKKDLLVDYTSKPGGETAWTVGAAAHWQQASQNVANTFGRDELIYTIDGQWESNGITLFVAGIGEYTSINPAGGTFQSNNFGLVVQGGYRFAEKHEVFARYDGLFLSRAAGETLTGNQAAPDVSGRNISFVTAGYNYYLFGTQNAKFTLDALIALNQTISTNAGTSGLLGGPAGNISSAFFGSQIGGNGIIGSTKAGEIVVRGQFQFAF